MMLCLSMMYAVDLEMVADIFMALSLLVPLNSGFGITVGVHRLWSHRSYSASFPVRFVLMLCNSIANQGE